MTAKRREAFYARNATHYPGSPASPTALAERVLALLGFFKPREQRAFH
jgi:hypothetical protein